MQVGEKIRDYRKSKNLTQKELSVLSGVAEITIRQYENKKREPKIRQLLKIAEALNISVNDILPDELNNAAKYAKEIIVDAGNNLKNDTERLINILSKLSYQQFHYFVDILEGSSYKDLCELIKYARHIRFDRENPLFDDKPHIYKIIVESESDAKENQL